MSRSCQPSAISRSEGRNSVYYVRATGFQAHSTLISSPGTTAERTPRGPLHGLAGFGDFETEFTFDASASYDPDNNLPLTYRWDFDNDGDYDIENVGDPYVGQVFGYPGTYQVNLQVEDTGGGRGNASRT